MEKADELFGEMKTFMTDNTNASEAGTNDPENDGLPYESFDDFSSDPVEFGEMTERMLCKVENLFDLTAVYNRHSEKYLKACVLLEKGIKFLGSACITKSALERENYSFPELSQLTTVKLYRMASFNYRKLDTALTEKLHQGNDLYPELLDMEFRYFSLLRRLRSTDTKIHNYHFHLDYGTENKDPVREGTAFSADSWTKCYARRNEEAPIFRQAPAFPLIKSSELGVRSSEKNGQRKAQGRNVCPQSSVPDMQKDPGGKSSELGVQSSEKNGQRKAQGANVSTQSSVPGTQKDPGYKSSALGVQSSDDKLSNFNAQHSTLNSINEIPHSEFRIPNSRKNGVPLITEIPDEPPEKLYERLRLEIGKSLGYDLPDLFCSEASDEADST